eukprot:m.3315 g.3315  ORF g.3315 m.3315 type:complete len:511 (-) comp2049_c0_seq1:50-1582(-)
MPTKGFWKRKGDEAAGRVTSTKGKKPSSFEQFNASVSDAWGTQDDDLLEREDDGTRNNKLHHQQNQQVGKGESNTINTSKTNVHTELATTTATSTTSTTPPSTMPSNPSTATKKEAVDCEATYISEDVLSTTACDQDPPPSSPKRNTSQASLIVSPRKTPSRNARKGVPTPDSFDPLTRSEGETKSRGELNIGKFEKELNSGNVNLDALKVLSWSGVPSQVRAMVWRLLCGYLPANEKRRQATLERKREEYAELVAQYYDTRLDPENQKTIQQILLDVPRTSPAIETFQQRVVQELLERVLYMWAIRHPASGYVQGINDLCTPFFIVFMEECIDCDFSDCDVSTVAKPLINDIEADCFWCLSRLLDGIQDNYTPGQNGIVEKVEALEDITRRVNGTLVTHLEQYNVAFMQFSFRWINCLLMREMPVACTIRLWDTCLSEPDGFASFHVYICAAFLEMFSQHLLALNDFQDILCALQNLPTSTWSYEEVEVVLAKAFMFKTMFHHAQHHLK